MITIRNLVKSYDRKVNAVDIDSLDIREGEIFGFLGPNGAGKTSTLRMMVGILPPDSGSIVINGYDIEREPLAAKREFGYVSDDPNLFLRLKGMDYLNFLGDMYGVPQDDRRQRIGELGERFELTHALGNRIQSYSHGMRQKLVLIGALLHDPGVWIMDEPMTGLDPKSSFTLKEMMRRQADAGKTVLFSTHVLDTAEKVCDQVAIIHRGKILFCGTMEEMRDHFGQNESLEKLFLEITGEA
ncbi:MAG: ABC transporter ATP-binding protein [Christensenellales bacterium]|jgi:ABC-2 type transport system ATP-binding protein